MIINGDEMICDYCESKYVTPRIFEKKQELQSICTCGYATTFKYKELPEDVRDKLLNNDKVNI